MCYESVEKRYFFCSTKFTEEPFFGDTSRQKITAEDIAKLPKKSIKGIVASMGYPATPIDFFCTNQAYSMEDSYSKPRKAPILKGSKRELKVYFSQYSLENKTSSSIVSVRFMVNCKGETDNFDVISMRGTGRGRITLDDDNLKEIEKIAQEMPFKWKPAKFKNKKVDCYQVLILTIQNGQFVDVNYPKM